MARRAFDGPSTSAASTTTTIHDQEGSAQELGTLVYFVWFVGGVTTGEHASNAVHVFPDAETRSSVEDGLAAARARDCRLWCGRL